MKKIVVDISPTGDITVEDEQGEASDLARALEQALGNVSGRKRTCASKTRPIDQRRKQELG